MSCFIKPLNMNPTPSQVRTAEIQATLRRRGLAMEHSLAVFEGDEGHAIVDLASGESIDPPDNEVLALAIEWSELANSPAVMSDQAWTEHA